MSVKMNCILCVKFRFNLPVPSPLEKGWDEVKDCF